METKSTYNQPKTEGVTEPDWEGEMKVDVKLPGGGVILVCGGNTQTNVNELVRLLAYLPAVELICLRDSTDIHGNIVGGLICVRNAQMFPPDDNLIAEAIPPIKFELTRYPDEFPDFYYSSKKDNRDRNKLWKESLRIANQKSSTRGRVR